MTKLVITTIMILAVATCDAQELTTAPDQVSANIADFETSIRPLLMKYCANCHAPGDSGKLNFLDAMTKDDVAKHRELFASVAEQMNSRAMPPRTEEQPTEAERKLVVEWLTGTLKLKPNDTDRISQYVVATFEDRQGNLWFGTMHDGAARFDGKELKYFTKQDGLPTNVVTCFAEDKQGNLWVGTHSGVCKFDGEKFIVIGKANGLPNAGRPSAMATASVQADREGNIWVGIGQKLYRSQGDTFAEFKLPVDTKRISSFAIVPGRASLRLQDRNGNLWFGTPRGLNCYNPNAFDGQGSFTYFTSIF